jgi:predicted ATPase/DNA-binding CsgD family transcriptional regulator
MPQDYSMERTVATERDSFSPIHVETLPRSDRSGLPSTLTSLIGREQEIAAARAILMCEDVRLLTLTGPGGVGKTQLALAVARELRADFADDAVYVPLAPTRDPTLVTSAIALVLEIPDTGSLPLSDALKIALRHQQRLLLLDNFEHVLAAAPLVTDLLAACPHLKMLVTSRALLHVSGEHAFTVPPLALPEPERALSIGELTKCDAIRLFVTRAQEVKPSFAITGANASAVAGICQRLDGLPLAIELAAARTRALAPPALLAEMTSTLPLLTGGRRDAPDRLQTMQNAIAWSYDLLSENEQALFRRLVVFVGGFTLEAAQAVAGDRFVLDDLTSLVDKSLVQQEERPDGETRFSLLETIREYGLECLEEAGEIAAFRRRHAEHFLAFAEAEAPRWFVPGVPLLDRIDAEEANLRAALVWADEQADPATLLRLAAALAPSWELRVSYVEGKAWVERALARVPVAAHDHRRQIVAWFAGWFARVRGERTRALALVEEMTAGARAAGNEVWRAQALLIRAYVDQDEGAFDRQLAAATEALGILRRADESAWAAYAQLTVGFARYVLGDLDGAEDVLEEALTRSRAIDQPRLVGMLVSNLGGIARLRGDYAQAARLIRERLALSWDGWALRWCLEELGIIAALCGEAERAARLLGAAEVYRELLGVPLPAPVSTDYQAPIDAAKATLGEAVFAAAWAAGRRLTVEEARAEAAAVALDWTPAAAATTGPAVALGLTPRELEVVRLVAAGRSNHEIASAFFISVPTVKRHLTNVLGKLGLPSRSALNTYAHEHNLV